MGAVRVVIAGNFPIGCVPVYLAGANVTRLPGRPQRVRGAVQRAAAGRRGGSAAGAPARRGRVRGLLRGVRQGATRGARAGVRPGEDAHGVLRRRGRRVRLRREQVLRGARDGRVRGPGPVRELGRRAPDAARVRGHGRAALPRGARVPAADQVAGGADGAGVERALELIACVRGVFYFSCFDSGSVFDANVMLVSSIECSLRVPVPESSLALLCRISKGFGSLVSARVEGFA